MRRLFIAALLAVCCGVVLGQTKNFTPVEGANLKAKMDGAIVAGRAGAPQGRFWVGYPKQVMNAPSPSLGNFSARIDE